MTISSTVRKAGPYVGTGLVSSYVFAFKVFQASDVLVQQTDTSGNITTLALTSAYTVSLNSDQNASPGGTVNLVTALPTSYQLVIGSQVSQLQSTVITNNGGFYPTVVTDALDKLTILVQQQQQTLNSSLQLPFAVSGVSTVLPVPAANNLLTWNSAATALQSTPLSQIATQIAYGTSAAQQFSGTGSQTAFVLPATAGSVNNVQAFVSGVRQYPTKDYTLSGDGVTVTFLSAPSAGTSNILISYQQGLSQGYTDSAASRFSRSK